MADLAYRTRTEGRTFYRATDGELLAAVYQRTDNHQWPVLDFTGERTRFDTFADRASAERHAEAQFRKIRNR